MIAETQPDPVETTASEPDLRSVIADAVRTQREPDAETQAKPEAPRETPEATEPAAERTDGRDEHGRFAPKPDAPKADASKEAAVAPAEPVQGNLEAPPVRPPPGWSPASKAEFDKLPAHVQADIAKRKTEVNQGFAKLSEYKDLEPLAALAKQNGTTLSAAVNNYRHFEVQLEKDFLGGIDLLCQRFGVHPASLAQAMAQRVGGQAQAQPQQQRQAPQFDPTTVVEQARAAMRAEMQQEQVAQAVQTFARDPKNVYFENVKGTMAKLMQSDLATSLEDAYDKACRMTPEVASLINQRPASADPAAKQRAVADQARLASKATTGAPPLGIKASGSPDANLSLRETIAAARDAQIGRA